MSPLEFADNAPSDPIFWRWLVLRGKMPGGMDPARNEACSQAWIKEVVGEDELDEQRITFLVLEPFERWRAGIQ